VTVKADTVGPVHTDSRHQGPAVSFRRATRSLLRRAAAARLLGTLTLGSLALAACSADRSATEPVVSGPRADVTQAASLVGVLFVNEVESNLGVPGDWIELYNAGSVPLDVSNFLIKDNSDGRTDRLPAGSVIPAGGFLVLDENQQFSFGLGAADNVRLYAADGVTLIDRFDWTEHAATTYARCPDGSTNWATSTLSTRGAANDCAPRIVINEIESSGGTPGDWIELYNPSAVPVDLGGYIVKDNNDAASYALPAGTTIAAGGFLVLEESQFVFGLGGSDAVRLFRPNGTTLVDSHVWTLHSATTYGRCPDGTGALVTTAAPTKGTANSCSAPTTTVTFNEVESNGDAVGDWVELFNTGTAAVDLSGYVFRDNDNTRGYTLPSGTTIAPGGYLVLLESQFGFGLGAADEVRLFAPGGVTLVTSYAWTAHAATTFGRCPNGTGPFVTTTSSTRGVANDCSVAVRLNEIESSGGVPGDWIELFNAGSVAVDLGGFVLRDNQESNSYVIPAGTTIAAGGYLVLDEAVFGFGLGGADAVRFFAPGGATLLDSYTWTAHASTTYGRCPSGSGPFVTTTEPSKGAVNRCPGDVVFNLWPGDADIRTVDLANTFGPNMSGLSLQPVTGSSTGVLWAVRNGPGTLFRLAYLNGTWTPYSSRTWTGGKALRYPDGQGDVDAEGVLVRGSMAYVAAERNNGASSVSRNSILLYNVGTATGAAITALREWNLTADLPVVGANLGLEGITFVSDAYLTANGFFDESKGRAYTPADYSNHQGGLFFVGVEGNGLVYAYALDHVSGGFTRVASFPGGFNGAMDVTFDEALGQLWVVCDDTCQGRTAVHRIDTQVGSPTQGRFVITNRFDRPAGMPDTNNEGFTFAPLSSCVNGKRPVIWADDNQLGGFALRQGTLTCAPF
jgi:hypothetical protein